MNRRQFFKTVAAITAGVVAVGVAPRVVRCGKTAEPVLLVANHATRCWVREKYTGLPNGGYFVEFGEGNRIKTIYLYETNEIQETKTS